MAEGRIRPVAALSGNRSFPARVHPGLDLGFLMSPPLVVAFGLAGDAERDLTREPLQVTADGLEVFLADLWPTREEVAEHSALAADPADHRRAFALASAKALWHALEAPETPRFPWNPASTALRRPPFAALGEGSQLGRYSAYPLLAVGDDITTDHISPASAIPPDSLVADFLAERGDDRGDLNVFASRRGNWEVMMRAAFHSKTLVDLLRPGMPVAHTLHVPGGDVQPIWEVAERCRRAGEPVVLVAGERCGTGSSRDWAAKGQRLLGIRAVLAVSFERIHRSNLIGMGILPLRPPAGVNPTTLDLRPGDRIEIDANPAALEPRCAVLVRVHRADGRVEAFAGTAAVEAQLDVELLRDGGVIASILGKDHRPLRPRWPGAASGRLTESDFRDCDRCFLVAGFAPNGRLRATIDLGNPNPRRHRPGHRRAARRVGGPGERLRPAARRRSRAGGGRCRRQVSRCRQRRAGRHRLLRGLSGARRRHRLHRAVGAPRGLGSQDACPLAQGFTSGTPALA